MFEEAAVRRRETGQEIQKLSGEVVMRASSRVVAVRMDRREWVQELQPTNKHESEASVSGT